MTNADLGFSIIVNTTDRAASLQTLLRALEAQSYPHFEVIVVVGPTRDNTLEVLDPYLDRIELLRCAQANLSQSRNVGLLAARGEIVAFIDDDAVPCQRWLAQLAQLFRDENVAGTGGIVHLVHPNAPHIQHRIGLVSSLAEQIDARRSRLAELVPAGLSHWWIERMMGTNMAFRRSALLEIGGFDEFYEWVYDDTDVCLRLAAAGKLVQPVLEAPVYHVPASSRNRVAYSYLGKWWIRTKAALYFSFKNGALAGDPWRARLLRSLYLVHGHWLWTGSLYRERRISFGQLANMRWQEVKSAVQGASAGLWRPRSLIDKEAAARMSRSSFPLRPFQRAASAKQPAVDPVSGRHPALTLSEPPLRICLLSHAYPPEQYEGVGRHTNLMARSLFELGHTVHVIAYGEREQVAFYDGAYVHRIPYKLERYARYRSLGKLHHALNYSHAVHDKVKRLLLNDGIQVVDSPVWQVDGLVTALAGLLPVVVRPQTALRQVALLQQDRDDDVRLVGELEQTLIRHAAYLVSNSQATVAAMEKVYGIQTTTMRYEIVPHGIEPVPNAAVRPFNLQAAPATLTVLYVGRLEKRKGILELFAAVPQVVERIPNVRFVIAGADNSRSDGFLERTGLDYPTFFAHQYPSYSAYIQFLGRVGDDELQRLYQECDLFVAPSLYESFGLIYLEAMNYAKPVIGCRAGGIPEVVEDGVTGLLVEPESSVALADAIATLLRSPARLRELGLAGRQRLLDRFTHLQMARGFERVYRQVIAAGAPSEGGEGG